MDYSSGEIYPFTKWYTSVNGNAGISVNTLSNWKIKLNASTGYRSPSLAELSSNGLHEGTFRYEIGNPKMKVQQNLNTEINVNYESPVINFYGAVYLTCLEILFICHRGYQLYGLEHLPFSPGRFKALRFRDHHPY